MTRIGLLSDTHGYLDPRVLEHFACVDEIWHAGDIGSAMVLQHLREFKPTRAVYGNMDSGDVRYSLSEFYRFRVEEVNVLMTHIGGYPGKYEGGKVITGLEDAQAQGATVYHAGTKKNEAGEFVTAGGRVLGVCATAPTLKESRRSGQTRLADRTDIAALCD